MDISLFCTLAKMLKASTDITKKVSVINRLVFASSVLPSDCPKFWEIVCCFATKNEDTKTQASLTPEKTIAAYYSRIMIVQG